MNRLSADLIYLLACAVNGRTPDQARVRDMDLENLYLISKFHSVRAAVCIALERAGIQDAQFHQAYKKTVRKNICLDVARAEITAEFEKHGIWYMPLKGAVLKEIYPETGMREMADNDLLYDAEKQQEVMEIMLSKGYTAESVGKSNHDIYMKPPVLNFELHTALFGENHAEPLYRYYHDSRLLLQKDDGSSCAFRFSDEDFYVFMTAHEWKHYSGAGTGLRSLLDCYVFCKAKGDSLDLAYIRAQIELLALSEFEQSRRELAEKIFSSEEMPALTESEEELLNSYLEAGTYGTFENKVKQQLKDKSRFAFWRDSIFISRKEMEHSVPFTAKSPLLYPVGVAWRCGRVLFCKRDRLKQTVQALEKAVKKRSGGKGRT